MTARPVFTRVGRWVAGAACAVLLSACAVPEWQKPGTPASEIAHSMGEPTLRVNLPDGGQRWVYSRQPMGQQVYHFEFDGQQQLRTVRQVLQPQHFYALRVGIDTEQQVLQYFGPPALVERVASFKGDLWTYRFYENGADRQAHVFLDPQRVVQRIQFTDEWRNDHDRE